MQRITELWKSGAGGKFSIIAGVAVIAGLCCCGGFLALAALSPSSSPTAIAQTQGAGQPSATIPPIPTDMVTVTPETAQTNEPSAVEPTSAPTPSPEPAQPTEPPGLTLDDPAPLGTTLIVDGNAIMVTGAQRGQGVWDMVYAGNMFNTEPEAGQEYVMVDIVSLCTDDDDCRLAPSDFYVIGSNRVVYESEWLISGVDGTLTSTEYLNGGNVTGKLFFIIAQGETGLVLKYAPLFTFSVPPEIYFSLGQ